MDYSFDISKELNRLKELTMLNSFSALEENISLSIIKDRLNIVTSSLLNMSYYLTSFSNENNNEEIKEEINEKIMPELEAIYKMLNFLNAEKTSTFVYKNFSNFLEDLKHIFRQNVDINKYMFKLTPTYNMESNLFSISGYIYLRERKTNNDFGFICRFAIDSHEELDNGELIELTKYKLNMLTSTKNKIKSWNNDKAFDTISDLKNDFLTWIKQNIS